MLVDFMSGQLSICLFSACYSPSYMVQRLVAVPQKTVHAAGKDGSQDYSMAAPRRWQGCEASSAGQCRESKHVRLAEARARQPSGGISLNTLHGMGGNNIPRWDDIPRSLRRGAGCCRSVGARPSDSR